MRPGLHYQLSGWFVGRRLIFGSGYRPVAEIFSRLGRRADSPVTESLRCK